MVSTKKTWLVTGGAGFIGSNFVLSTLAKSNVRVINLDKLTYAGNPNNLCSLRSNPDHIFVQGEIADRELLRSLFEQYQPQAIVNFAAESHVDRSIDGPSAFIQTNVVGTFELLDESRAYWQSLAHGQAQEFRFLHVSTDEVYGSLGKEGAFVETTAYAPNSPYAASKASADHLVRAYHHTYHFPTLTTNCSNNYGPYQFPEKLIPLMVLNALDHKPLPVYGDGSNVRDWLYVEDHCEALRMVLDRAQPGSCYNIGGGQELTNLTLVETLCELLESMVPCSTGKGYKSLITFVKDRPGHDLRYAIDAGKIKQDLGWQPAHDFASGIRKTVQWYLDNATWCTDISEKRYQRERLGLSANT
jgi:dTDP-glucose 4,6-dehydratase